MSPSGLVAITGFVPWRDDARGVAVRENPAALAAYEAVRVLSREGRRALYVPVEVSADGIGEALALLERLLPSAVVSLGQGRDVPRVERLGRVPLAARPRLPDEASPWPLPVEAEALARHLNGFVEPAAGTGPFVPSDDAGAYFCDHLCVELVRLARRRPLRAAFLHVPPIDGLDAMVREARLRQYARQAVAATRFLTDAPSVA